MINVDFNNELLQKIDNHEPFTEKDYNELMKNCISTKTISLNGDGAIIENICNIQDRYFRVEESLNFNADAKQHTYFEPEEVYKRTFVEIKLKQKFVVDKDKTIETDYDDKDFAFLTESLEKAGFVTSRDEDTLYIDNLSEHEFDEEYDIEDNFLKGGFGRGKKKDDRER